MVPRDTGPPPLSRVKLAVKMTFRVAATRGHVLELRSPVFEGDTWVLDVRQEEQQALRMHFQSLEELAAEITQYALVYDPRYHRGPSPGWYSLLLSRALKGQASAEPGQNKEA